MRCRRRWRAAAFSSFAVAVVPLVGSGYGPSPSPAAAGSRPITVTRLLAPDGDPLNGVDAINDAGEVAAYELDPEAVLSQAPYLWRDGMATPVRPDDAGSPLLGDLSETGQVVGWYAGSAGYRGFSWRAGRWTPLEYEGGGAVTRAEAVNDRGWILGDVLPMDSTGSLAAVWDKRGRVIAVVDPGGQYEGLAINNRGQALLDTDRTAAIWQVGGGVTPLGTLGGQATTARDINDAGEVTGVSATAADERHAFVWRDGRMVDLGTLGGDWSAAYDINEAGQVAGASEAADGSRHAVLWDTDGRLIDLGTLGGESAEAHALNDRGQVVGTSTLPSGDWHVFLWEAGRMTDLNVLAGDNTPAGRAVDINERGQIVGSIWDEDVPSEDFVAVLWSAPPRR